jgi:hypothetical protein
MVEWNDIPSGTPLLVPGFIRLGPTVDGSGGAVDGPIGIGVDLAGTVRDANGVLTYENHAVGAQPGEFGALPAVVRILLLLAIPEYLALHADSGWTRIRSDLLKGGTRSGIHSNESVADADAVSAPPPERFAFLFRNGGGEPPEGRERWPPERIKPPPPPPPFQPARYVFTLASMRITNTRSRHEDTDKASVSVAIGDGQPLTVTRDLGDHNNGTFALGISTAPFAVDDPGIGIACNYLILNSGHQDWKTVDEMLQKAGGALAAAGAKAATAAIGSAIGAELGTTVLPVVGTVIGLIAGWAVGELIAILTANCDGPVAAEQPAFKGIDLWNRTHGPGNMFSHETYHPGIDSATGCGSNSEYYTTWSVTRVG